MRRVSDPPIAWAVTHSAAPDGTPLLYAGAYRTWESCELACKRINRDRIGATPLVRPFPRDAKFYTRAEDWID